MNLNNNNVIFVLLLVILSSDLIGQSASADCFLPPVCNIIPSEVNLTNAAMNHNTSYGWHLPAGYLSKKEYHTLDQFKFTKKLTPFAYHSTISGKYLKVVNPYERFNTLYIDALTITNSSTVVIENVDKIVIRGRIIVEGNSKLIIKTSDGNDIQIESPAIEVRQNSHFRIFCGNDLIFNRDNGLASIGFGDSNDESIFKIFATDDIWVKKSYNCDRYNRAQFQFYAHHHFIISENNGNGASLVFSIKDRYTGAIQHSDYRKCMAWLNTETMVTKSVDAQRNTKIGFDHELGISAGVAVEGVGPTAVPKAEGGIEVTSGFSTSSSVSYTLDENQLRLFKAYSGRPANVTGTPIPQIFPLGKVNFNYDFLPDGICAPQNQPSARIFNPVGNKRDELMNQLHIKNEDLIELDRTILAYPNPANDYINLRQVNDVKFKAISMFDIFGRPIRVIENINAPYVRIDLSDIKFDRIFLEIIDMEGNRKSELITITK